MHISSLTVVLADLQVCGRPSRWFLPTEWVQQRRVAFEGRGSSCSCGAGRTGSRLWGGYGGGAAVDATGRGGGGAAGSQPRSGGVGEWSQRKTRAFPIQLPEGAVPGQVMQVDTPSGRVAFTVPHGVTAGQTVNIQVTTPVVPGPKTQTMDIEMQSLNKPLMA